MLQVDAVWFIIWRCWINLNCAIICKHPTSHLRMEEIFLMMQLRVQCSYSNVLHLIFNITTRILSRHADFAVSSAFSWFLTSYRMNQVDLRPSFLVWISGRESKLEEDHLPGTSNWTWSYTYTTFLLNLLPLVKKAWTWSIVLWLNILLCTIASWLGMAGLWSAL